MRFEFITKQALEGVKMALNGEGVTIKDRDPPVRLLVLGSKGVELNSEYACSFQKSKKVT